MNAVQIIALASLAAYAVLIVRLIRKKFTCKHERGVLTRVDFKLKTHERYCIECDKRLG